jgi:acetolactate synthase-1/2/3 large subunit
MSRDRELVEVEGAAEAYLKVLQANDVEYFFTSPGSEDAPFWEYLTKMNVSSSDSDHPPIKPINCRHEGIAVAMAKGYTMVTGTPQVVKLHVASGTLHAAMELYGAYISSIPLVVISSYSSTHEKELQGGSPGPHYLDFHVPGGVNGLVDDYVKWHTQLDSNANAERYISRALRVAKSPPQGPTFVNISRELLFDDTKTQAKIIRDPPARPTVPDQETIELIASELNAAENPILITGEMPQDDSAVPNLVDLTEKRDMLVYENPKWYYNYPMDHPLYIGASSAGLTASPKPHLTDNVDLVFVLDSSKPWYPPEKGAPENAKIIIANREPVQEKLDYWNYPSDILVTTDTAKLLPELLPLIESTDEGVSVSRSAKHKEWREGWRDKVRSGAEKKPIDPFWLCYNIDQIIPNDAVITQETIVHGSITSNLISDSEDRILLHALNANAGGLGTGLGTALGAKLAEPDRLVVSLMGDGGYNYNPAMAAFGVAQEYDLPILAIIFDNAKYRSMQRNIDSHYPDGWHREAPEMFNEITPSPDYVSQIESFGGYGERVEDPQEIASALHNGVDAVNSGSTALIDVVLEEDLPNYPTY